MRFKILGPFEVEDHGRAISVGGPKQRLVLAHLVLAANTVVSTDKLVEHVWGETPPREARNSLQSYISRLRTALGEADRIVGKEPGYVLRAETSEVDSLEFEQLIRRAAASSDAQETRQMLEEAAALWRGEALADLAGEPSLEPQLVRLGEMKVDATVALIASRLESGFEGDVIPRLETLTALHPFRERLWSLLMMAYALAGRQGDALRTFTRAREVLVSELGVEPSSELQTMYERVLCNDFAAGTGARPARGYTLGDQIGQGTFGTVYRAIEPQLNREVAVKVIRSELADRMEFIQNFEAEAKLIARIEHPFVVPLYDFWREPGAAYLVMRLLRGGNLRTLIDDVGVEPGDAIRIVSQVAQALAFAHRLGVVHLDIKPENILLDEERNAYLSDFGIARDTLGSPVALQDVRATPYMSPEYRRGDRVGFPADVYSLGRVAQVLVERTPGTEPLDSLMAVVEKATSEVPDGRYPDAAAFLEALAPSRRQDVVASEAADANPYKGLRPFTESDAPDFFGREDLVERLLRRMSVREDGFVALVGPSGSGKSSVVRAGLLPALRAGRLPGSSDWLMVRMTPGTNPLAALARSLESVALRPIPGLVERARTGESLGDLIAPALPSDANLLIFCDQLEEAFTLVDDETETSAFLDVIASSRGGEAVSHRLVVTLRADFYDRALRHPAFATMLQSGTEPIAPLSAGQVGQAVNNPARRLGVGFDAEVVAAIQADLRDQGGALPLLQYTLTELFSQRSSSTIDMEAYRQVGGVRGALVTRAEALYSRLAPDEQRAARQLLLRLVALGEGTGDSGRRVLVAAVQDARNPELTDRVVELLGRHRLLAFDRDPDTRAPTVEVAHEALLTEWGRLRGWIDGARDDLRAQRKLAASVNDWESAGRDPDYLLRGSRLTEIEEWLKSSQIGPAGTEDEFVRESVRIREAERSEEAERLEREEALARRSARRLRTLIVGLSAAATVLSALALFAMSQQAEAIRQARVATARELASASVAALEDDPELSLLLAIEAVEATGDDGSTREAIAALHRAILGHRVVMGVPGDFPAAFDPSGNLFATALGDDAVIRLWSVPDAQQTGALAGHTAMPVQVEFTSDGSRLVSSSLDGTARLWDVGSETEVCRFVGHTDGVLSMSLSRDGGLVATRSFDNTVRVWDVATCRERMSADYNSFGLHFDPDGTQLAIAVAERGPVIIDVSTGEETFSYQSQARDVRFSPDGSLLAVAAGDSDTLLIEIETGEVRTLPGHRGLTETVDFSPDGTVLATGGQDGVARVWDVQTGRLMLEISGSGSNVEHVTFSPDGSLLAGAGTSGRVLVWDVTAQGSREITTFRASNGPVFSAQVSPEGDLVAAAGADGAPTVRVLADGSQVRSLTVDDRPGSLVWWSLDGTRLVTALSADNALTMWDRDGNVVSEIIVGPFALPSIHPSNTKLAISSDQGVVEVRDLGSGARIAERYPNLGFIQAIAWDPSGERVAAATQADVVWVWNPDTDEVDRLVGHSNVVNVVAWDPSGTQLASAGEDGSIRIWAFDDTPVRTIEAHTATIFGLAWSGDGTTIASGSFDSTLRVWDAETLEPVLVLPAGTPIGTVSITDDANYVAFGGGDGLVRVVTLDEGELLEIARSRVRRGLTDEECRSYLHLQACPEVP